MNLIALLCGLILERLLTKFLHWRRLRWLDRVIDSGFRQAKRIANWPPIIAVLLIAFILVLPVFALIFILDDVIHDVGEFAIAIIVLLFSIGPKDIGEEVDEYCAALASDDETKINNAAKAIIEGDVPGEPRERIARVEEAVCIQANNRLFAVIFWFVVLGPLAAWTYRVMDLIRRRAVFNAARDAEEATGVHPIRDAAVFLHGLLAWIPARLTALGYTTAGHADDAIAALRAPNEETGVTLSTSNEKLLARVGVAALSIHDIADESDSERGIRGATAANKLVFRLLMVCVVIIAAMTLYGYSR